MAATPGDRQALSRAEIADQLRRLGVAPGGVLLAHVSYRAARPVSGGPAGLIAALRTALGPDGTLVMPSWTGCDDRPFDPAATAAAADLGVTADTFWRQPGVARATHPFAFAAAGPHADEILRDPLPLPPHIPQSPVGRVHDLDGQVLLIGAGHDANTTLHLAEWMAGVPYRVTRHITIAGAQGPERIDYLEVDHCCARFALTDDWLRREGRQPEGKVGHAPARLIRARDVVRVAMGKLAANPLIFLHPAEAGCTECDEARASLAM